MSGLSRLEKDQKTFDYLCIFNNIIMSEKKIFEADSKIQEREIEEHCRRVCKEDTLEWIDTHGEPEREYLNAIKMLLTLFIQKKLEINWNNFCCLVDDYNVNWFESVNTAKNLLFQIHN